MPPPVPLLRRRAIPCADAGGVSVHGVWTEPGRRALALMIDERAVASGPLVRGAGPPFLVREREGRRVRVQRQAEQRAGFATVAGPAPNHLDAFARAAPARRPVAVTGCGNLGLNPGVLAWRAGREYGACGAFNGAIALDAGGRARPASWPSAAGEELVLTGPLLVRDGIPVAIDPANHPDPRHLLLFPYVEVRPGERADFGCDALLADPRLYARAAAGEPVELPLEVALPEGDDVDSALRPCPVGAEEARRALCVKGYRECDAPAEPGTARVYADRMTIVFARGIYPHHVLAVAEDGAAGSILAGGLSNRCGVALAELAEDLAAGGLLHALLLDNGGDVGLWLPQEHRFALRPAEPDRAATWPLSACLVYHEAGRH